jgi:hypothetical protein
MTMFENSGERLIPPSQAQLEQQRKENEAARREFEAKRKAEATEQAKRFEQLEAEREAGFKAECRAKYAALSDADFERLWPTTIRDKELLE